MANNTYCRPQLTAVEFTRNHVHDGYHTGPQWNFSGLVGSVFEQISVLMTTCETTRGLDDRASRCDEHPVLEWHRSVKDREATESDEACDSSTGADATASKTTPGAEDEASRWWSWSPLPFLVTFVFVAAFVVFYIGVPPPRRPRETVESSVSRDSAPWTQRSHASRASLAICRCSRGWGTECGT